MSPIVNLLLATVAFLALHFIPSTPWRAGLVARLGQRSYLAIYSIAALAALIWMGWTYARAPREFLWEGWRLLPLVVMPFSLILIVAGYTTRNPTAVMQERALQSTDPARGIVRITRHPLMWGITLWAGAHTLARGDVKSLIFFGGFLTLALLGTVLIDRRRAALGEDWRRFSAVTSNVPFLAIAQGRNRFIPSEIGYQKPLIGLAVFVVLFLLHPYLFGARPY
jgi:uncharacterized membrane protein